MEKSTKPKLVLVTWNDAHSPNSTDMFNLTDLSQVHGCAVIVTLGWLLRQDEIGVTVASEDCGDGNYRTLTFIPQAMVISVDTVNKQRKSKRKEPNNAQTSNKDGQGILDPVN